MSADNDILTGTIRNMETGETSTVEHLMFLNDAAIYTVVQVEKVQHYIHETNMEVRVECKALDNIGFVGRVEVVFNPDNQAEMDAILKEITPNKVYAVNGPFGWPVDNVVTIHDPEYRELSHEESEKIREVIRVNEKAT